MKLVKDSKTMYRFHSYLSEANKYYEVGNTMKTVSTSLSKRIHSFDKYVEPPVKYSRVFDLNSKIDRSIQINDNNIAQVYCNTA